MSEEALEEIKYYSEMYPDGIHKKSQPKLKIKDNVDLKEKIDKIEKMFNDETLNKYYHGMSYEFEIDEFKEDIFKITKGEENGK